MCAMVLHNICWIFCTINAFYGFCHMLQVAHVYLLLSEISNKSFWTHRIHSHFILIISLFLDYTRSCWKEEILPEPEGLNLNQFSSLNMVGEGNWNLGLGMHLHQAAQYLLYLKLDLHITNYDIYKTFQLS